MTYQTMPAEAGSLSGYARRIWRRLSILFAMLGNAMVAAASANRRLQLVQQLNEKSDEELARMGLRREDIVRRVFIDMLDV